MPIKGAYTWSEKSDSLLVSVPLKGVSAKLVDIVVSATTVKVGPYTLACASTTKPLSYPTLPLTGELLALPRGGAAARAHRRCQTQSKGNARTCVV